MGFLLECDQIYKFVGDDATTSGTLGDADARYLRSGRMFGCDLSDSAATPYRECAGNGAAFV